MKYSTTKISPAKINSSAGHALIKSPGLRSKDLSISDLFFIIIVYHIFIIPMLVIDALPKVTKVTWTAIKRDGS